MQRSYDFSEEYGYPQSDTLYRFSSTLMSVAGAVIIAILLGRVVEVQASGWSPTETAKRCFSYPEEALMPDNREIGQMLLSAAFFGSDALYFDAGEENTGQNPISEVSPSEMPDEDKPYQPIDDGKGESADQDDLYFYDRSLLQSGEVALLPYDLTGNPNPGDIRLSNTTSYNIDTSEIINREYPIAHYNGGEPLVLIIHTHGTESYAPEGAVAVPSGYVARDSNTANNMIAVGAVMSELLNDAGITTLHCEIMHDLESYNRSYDLAADTIQKYLAEYPSIKYVFDVHRDAIVRENGDLIRPLTLINGERSAQIMLLVGTNEKGADHPDWETNMTVAVELQHRLTNTYSRFARPINIRGASFNQQFTPGSLLIEIGSAANTLSEAKTAAKYLTYSIIDMLKENK